MKTITIITHPLVQVFSFLIIIISGESFGGPYMLYLYHAGAEGRPYALIGIAGTLLVLSSLFWQRQKMQIIAVFLMLLSLVIFFVKVGGSYNNNTFHEVLPIMTLLFFAIVNGLVLYENIQPY